MEIKTLPIKWSVPTNYITGVVIETRTMIYVIRKNGSDEFQVDRMDKNHKWNRYWTIDRFTMKGSAGLPKAVIEAIQTIKEKGIL
ncbi:hypothetical protein [Geobacillus phage TP-84]|uniref:Uncharacterized protein n=1 Tax=Geobacillus phage TP-84 TaxID=1965361 RepID=A0A1U9WQL0_9CAUD|nr:hypothetical protein MUK65_gp32 [Geobacillus phage TP-84]AQY55049.1 hypothetical protein [Geobacillus phage TP-84]